MDNLVERLRDLAERVRPSDTCSPMLDAADEIDGLWQAIDCARRSVGYSDPKIGVWFDHFFPKKIGEPPPFDMTDPRHKREPWPPPDAAGGA